MKRSSVLFLTLFALPSAAHAAGGFSVGVEGGVMEFNSRASLNEAGMAWGLRAGFRLLGPTRLEARFLSAGHELGGNTVNLRQGSALLHVALLPGRRTTPYAFAGVGMRMSSTDLPGQMGESALIVPFGGGFDIAFGDHILLAPEFTWHHRATQSSMGVPPIGGDTWNVSLVFKLEV